MSAVLVAYRIRTAHAQGTAAAAKIEAGALFSGECTNLSTRYTGTMSLEVVRTDRSGWAQLRAEWIGLGGKGDFEGSIGPTGELDFQGLVEAHNRIYEATLAANLSGRTLRGTYTLTPSTGAERPPQQGEFFLLRRK
jgi:hypothetical protein